MKTWVPVMVIDFDNDNGCADADWHTKRRFISEQEFGDALGTVVGFAVIACVILGAVAAVVWG